MGNTLWHYNTIFPWILDRRNNSMGYLPLYHVYMCACDYMCKLNPHVCIAAPIGIDMLDAGRNAAAYSTAADRLMMFVFGPEL